MAITVDMIKQLREQTGAGMMDCKKALNETEGNMEEALKWLRKKGIANAEKKAGRTAAEGLVYAYIHGEGRIGVMVEVNVETDFAARNEAFKAMVHDVALQVASMNPRWVSSDEIPEDILESEKDIARTQAKNEGKPDAVVEKIVEGRLKKFYAESCLLDQPFVKDDSKTIQQLVTEMIATIGENVKIRRFTRYELGEGLEKKSDDFAGEVMAQLGK